MKTYNDFILIITWPYGLVKGAYSWYDCIFSSKGNYKFGHTALILVNSKNGTNHYFDYGRFEGSKKLGRIRSSISDKTLHIKTRSAIKNGVILNIDDVLHEINNNQDAKNLFLNNVTQLIYGAIIKNINFNESYKIVNDMMKRKYQYGPFIFNGLTCGRFVYKIVYKSNASISDKFKTIFFDIIIRFRRFEKLAVKTFFKHNI